MRLRSLTWFALAGLAACGTDPLDPIETAERLEPPVLRSIAPTELTVGEKVTVLADDLPDPEVGEVKLHLKGTYSTATGKEYQYDGDLPVKVDNVSVGNFEFRELYFDPNQAETGTWRGTAHLIVTPKVGFGDDVAEAEALQVESNEIEVNLRVGPSIVLDKLQSTEGSGCADVTKATNAGHQIALGFRAIGLGEASEYDPWTFRMQYTSPIIKVRYVKEDALGGFDGSILGDLALDDTVSTDAPDRQNSLAVTKTSGNSLMLNPRTGATVARINPPVEIGLNLYDEVIIGRLSAGPLDRPFGKNSANIILEIETADGRSLRRSVNFDIFNEVEIGTRVTSARVVERYAPEQTCGCVPAGVNELELQYSEGSSISRNRSLNFRWDQSTSTTLGFMIGSFAPVIQANGSETFNQTFGVDISEAVTSEIHKSSNYSRRIVPGWYGTCYRQLEEYEKTVEIVYHNACGAAGTVGEAILTDYLFGFDVAMGSECAPETNLPPAESFRDAED